MTASPDTSVPAARRAAPRPRTDKAENEANTEFPSEQDPLAWGDGPTSRITGPERPGGHARNPKDAVSPRSPMIRSEG
ncbi:hypothetical protein GCM10010266_07700 [Streptomyces griseomycini]|nr:hypothetical protein GCM10010266_07700 [Streptomyces griseomycini]